MEQLESTEFVADFVTTAGAVATDDEDDKNSKPKGRQTHKMRPLYTLSRSILLYLALTRKAQNLCSIFASEITKHWPAQAVNNLRARELLPA